MGATRELKVQSSKLKLPIPPPDDFGHWILDLGLRSRRRVCGRCWRVLEGPGSLPGSKYRCARPENGKFKARPSMPPLLHHSSPPALRYSLSRGEFAETTMRNATLCFPSELAGHKLAPMSIIQARELSRWYGIVMGLNNVTFDIEAGLTG